MNTSKYPRTVKDAFKDADYACALERPRSTGHTVAGWAMLLGGVVVVLVLFGVM